MNTRPHLLLIILAFLLNGCSGFDPLAYVPGMESTATTTPVPAPSREVSLPISVTVTNPAAVAVELVEHAATVCTNISGGKLNVRFTAGDKSDVRGYLAEGETVTISEEHQELDGNSWVKLASPIEGWVNSKYLCEAVSP
jgi:hypothetical protein